MIIRGRNIDKLIAYILLNLLVPLLPFFFEILYTGSLTIKTFLMGSAMYAISLSLTSKNVASFSFGFVYAIIMTGSLGKYSNTEIIISIFKYYQFYGLILMMIFIIIERYKRHVIDKEEVLIFFGGKE